MGRDERKEEDGRDRRGLRVRRMEGGKGRKEAVRNFVENEKAEVERRGGREGGERERGKNDRRVQN